MFGGTPCNVALTSHLPGRIEILTGVNLPMVLKLACQGVEETSVAEVARWLQAKTQRSVCLASDMGPPLPPTGRR
jgi:PTS system mannose-specific IIA component